MAALKKLTEPEPESRSQDFEGRRMVRIDGGYVILNFMKYRDKDHTGAERAKRYRERKKGIVTRDVTLELRDVTHAEVRVQSSDAEIKTVGRAVAPTDGEWIASLKTNSAYAGLDVDREIAKCQTWCGANGKVASKRRIVNWLNRSERPIGTRDTGPVYREAT